MKLDSKKKITLALKSNIILKNRVQKFLSGKPNLKSKFLTVRIPKVVTAMEHHESSLVAGRTHVYPTSIHPLLPWYNKDSKCFLGQHRAP